MSFCRSEVTGVQWRLKVKDEEVSVSCVVKCKMIKWWNGKNEALKSTWQHNGDRMETTRLIAIYWWRHKGDKMSCLHPISILSPTYLHLVAIIVYLLLPCISKFWKTYLVLKNYNFRVFQLLVSIFIFYNKNLVIKYYNTYNIFVYSIKNTNCGN